MVAFPAKRGTLRTFPSTTSRRAARTSHPGRDVQLWLLASRVNEKHGLAVPRRKSPTRSDDPRHPPASDAVALSGTRADAQTVVTVVVFLVALVVYLVLFFRGEYAAGLSRYESLLLVLVPDQLAEQWFGRPAGRVNLWDRVPLVLTALGIWMTALLSGGLLLNWLRLAGRLTRAEARRSRWPSV